AAARGPRGEAKPAAGHERAGRWHAKAHADRDWLIGFVIFVRHLPHVRAGRDLEGADIAPAEVHAVVAQISAAIELVEADAADAGTDGELGLVGGVPDRHHPLVDVLRALDDVLLNRGIVLLDDLGLERLA